jgi:hypothetical protein
MNGQTEQSNDREWGKAKETGFLRFSCKGLVLRGLFRGIGNLVKPGQTRSNHFFFWCNVNNFGCFVNNPTDQGMTKVKKFLTTDEHRWTQIKNHVGHDEFGSSNDLSLIARRNTGCGREICAHPWFKARILA